ncbi:hypothetical protein EJ03DRAFT_335607 [Teratosphaeria nubilosa]|uniref:F-box domain-containing protein n=1 Tax=Teratosphaeria nubilosa TaxID=161662 RepID=A0A6G1LDC2_9PEZI|nr:hypothetical protein EJ03DRAFT_335607 [Teratosphaeria nubilosa]
MISTMLEIDLLASAPSNTSSSKAHRVFGLPELCEQILVHLSPKELLSDMLVNRAFARTISTSPSLLAILTLRPDRSSSWRSNFRCDYGYENVFRTNLNYNMGGEGPVEPTDDPNTRPGHICV